MFGVFEAVQGTSPRDAHHCDEVQIAYWFAYLLPQLGNVKFRMLHGTYCQIIKSHKCIIIIDL